MLIGNDSPYPEVRAAVANFDDPDMPASTIRAWTIGLIWAIILPSINQFFLVGALIEYLFSEFTLLRQFRYPSVVVTSVSTFTYRHYRRLHPEGTTS
jgi:hypothetical protein